MRIKSWMLCLGLCWGLVPSHIYAQTQLPRLNASQKEWKAYLKSSSIETINQLIRNKIQKVGDLDLVKLRQEIESVQWSPFTNGFIVSLKNRDRISALYDPKVKLATFNVLSVTHGAPESFRVLTLHEALGALGYVDSEFQISLLLDLLSDFRASESEPGSPEFKVDLSTHIPTSTLQSIAQGGGASGAGGGGDVIEVEVKRELIKTELAKLNPSVSGASVQARVDFLFDIKISVDYLIDSPVFTSGWNRLPDSGNHPVVQVSGVKWIAYRGSQPAIRDAARGKIIDEILEAVLNEKPQK